MRFLCKFPVNSRAIFLRNDFIIVRLSHLRNPAKNMRIAELRLMRNPPTKLLAKRRTTQAEKFPIRSSLCYNALDHWEDYQVHSTYTENTKHKLNAL